MKIASMKRGGPYSSYMPKRQNGFKKICSSASWENQRVNI